MSAPILNAAPHRPKHPNRRRFGGHGTLESCYTGRDNGIGLIRHTLAVAVVVAHATSLGFGWEDLGQSQFRGQTNVGTLAVFGFFVLSGLLITRSAGRTPIGRYAWHRALRILPGLWVCLLVTAFVVAPVVALHERGTLTGFLDGPRGSLQYVWGNWFVGVRQYGIHDLLAGTTPWGRETHSSVFNGALWSLIYELTCYVLAGLVAVTGVRRWTPWLLPLAAVALYARIIADQVQSRLPVGPPAVHYGSTTLPLFGAVSHQWLMYLGFAFLLGALLEIYRHRIPIHDGLGVAAVAVLAGSLLAGGLFVAGLPALAYLLVWAAVRMPRRLRRVGRVNDYSYGIYIYGFVVQQALVTFGAARWGYVPFTALSLTATAGLGWLSWHLIERRALALKDWQPRARRTGHRPPGRSVHADEPQRHIDGRGDPQADGEHHKQPLPH
jgi:peptidoglycan/LPS O-acetylase OafA/YrhL